MRNVRQQYEIPLAAFDQARYEFCHNADLRLGKLMRRFALVSAIAAITGSAAAQSASIYTISPKMRGDVACMYNELKKVPGIDQVKLGAVEWLGWVYPYLEYRAMPDRHGYRYLVRYVPNQSCTNVPDYAAEDFRCVLHAGPYSFMTILPGLSATNEPGPSDWGTPGIEKRWKAACGVSAWGVFV